MSSRIFSAGVCLLIAACGGPPERVAAGNTQDVATGTPAEASAERIDCAIETAAYARTCTIERTAGAGGVLLTIRHPDGGFHRLRLSADGGDVVAADGALPAKILARNDSAIEVAIGDARYRLPLTR